MQRSIVLKSTGFSGLGDLLLALERAIMVAQATDRSLVVDWSDTPYSRGETNLFEELFILDHVRQLPVQSLEYARGSVVPTAWHGCLSQSFRRVYSDHCNQDWNRNLAVKKLDAGASCFKSNAEWLVLWDHLHPPSSGRVSSWPVGVDRSPLATLLRPSQHIEEIIHSFRQKSFSSSMIGAHVRLDNDAIQAGKSVSCEHFYERIDQLRSEHPNAGIFLASDNQDVVSSFLDRYPDVVIKSKWLPKPGQAVHLSEGLSASGLAIAEDALVDLFLLASCHWIIHPSQSSFSIAAARCSGLAPSRIYSLSTSSASTSTQWQWPEAGWINREQMLRIPAEEISNNSSLPLSPAVSIIMLAFNHASWLEEAVESVMHQRFNEPFELLIGEDRSSDGTLELAIRLQQRWPQHIRIIHASRNVGIRDNVLRLVVRAKAPLIAFLEGDDYWICDSKLSQQVDLLRTDPSLSCVAGLTNNRPHILPSREAKVFQLRDLLRRYVVHSSSLMFRAEHLIPYPNFPDGAFDSMLLAFLGAKGNCGMISTPLSYYRRHPGGYWTGAHRSQRLRLSRQCIDAIDAYFDNSFRRELTDRELWIHVLDSSLPDQKPWRHWRETWRLQLSQAPRLLRRAPGAYLLLLMRTLIQPVQHLHRQWRSRLALGRRLRQLHAATLVSSRD